MVKAIKIINWVCLSLGVIGIVGLYRYQNLYRYNPSIVGFTHFFLLLPYGLALIAFREDTRKAGLWAALAVNLIYGTFFAVLIVVVIVFGPTGSIGSPILAVAAVAAAGFLYGTAPCGLNVWVLIQDLRRASANLPLNRTRADDARAGS